MKTKRGRLRAHHAASLPANLIAAVLLAGTIFACTPAASSPAPTAVSTPTAVATLPPTEPPITPSPPPVATATAAAATACAPADLKASHGLVQGAAGSRIAEVILVSAVACSIDAFPALGLRDAASTALLSAPSSGPGRLDLVAGGTYTTNVRVANWCAAQPAFPLTLEIILGAGELPVTGGSFPEEGDLPPCNGSGGPILEGTAWTATA
jgi:hypothetical protein